MNNTSEIGDKVSEGPQEKKQSGTSEKEYKVQNMKINHRLERVFQHCF